MVAGGGTITAPVSGASKTDLGVRIVGSLLQHGPERGFRLGYPVKREQRQPKVQSGVDVIRPQSKHAFQTFDRLGVTAGKAIGHGGDIQSLRIGLDLRRDFNLNGEHWQHCLLHRRRQPERAECAGTVPPE